MEEPLLATAVEEGLRVLRGAVGPVSSSLESEESVRSMKIAFAFDCATVLRVPTGVRFLLDDTWRLAGVDIAVLTLTVPVVARLLLAVFTDTDVTT